jgi:hypothetical protein
MQRRDLGAGIVSVDPAAPSPFPKAAWDAHEIVVHREQRWEMRLIFGLLEMTFVSLVLPLGSADTVR